MNKSMIEKHHCLKWFKLKSIQMVSTFVIKKKNISLWNTFQFNQKIWKDSKCQYIVFSITFLLVTILCIDHQYYYYIRWLKMKLMMNYYNIYYSWESFYFIIIIIIFVSFKKYILLIYFDENERNEKSGFVSFFLFLFFYYQWIDAHIPIIV